MAPIASANSPVPAIAPSKTYTMTDAGVRPPVAARQSLPPFPAQLQAGRRGVLELVIDERGAVESVVVRESINPRYDDQLVSAARKWQYAPATLDGTPVKYRKLLQVNVQR
jgi:TonB family protein